MSVVKIGDRLVGEDQPTYIIAEIGVNHNGILDYAFRLIDAAVESGADAVKFQKRNLQNLYPEKYLQNSNIGEKNLNYLLPILQRVELSDADYYRLVEYCNRKEITFLCSAFDEDSADFAANTIVRELSHGYRIDDRTLRPAKVSVSRAICLMCLIR